MSLQKVERPVAECSFLRSYAVAVCFILLYLFQYKTPSQAFFHGLQ